MDANSVNRIRSGFPDRYDDNHAKSLWLELAQVRSHLGNPPTVGKEEVYDYFVSRPNSVFYSHMENNNAVASRLWNIEACKRAMHIPQIRLGNEYLMALAYVSGQNGIPDGYAARDFALSIPALASQQVRNTQTDTINHSRKIEKILSVCNPIQSQFGGLVTASNRLFIHVLKNPVQLNTAQRKALKNTISAMAQLERLM